MKRAIFRAATLLAAALAGLIMAGCSHLPAEKQGMAGASTQPAPTLPLLRLPPAALGHELSEQQLLTISGPDGQSAQLEAMLEVDARDMRLAFLKMGRVMARLDWDGEHLRTTESEHWPKSLSQERILSDVQMALWPLPAIQAQLPATWLMVENGHIRRLRQGNEDKIIFTTNRQGRMDIEYLQSGWRLTIESRESLHGSGAAR